MPDGAADAGAARIAEREVLSDRKVAFLRDPASYPELPARVEVVETHFSWVFLTETRAYKLKKPVTGDGFDFRSAAARHRNAVTEVRLNRRLAPDIYLGVVPITLGADGALAIAGDGPAIDWLVEMVRLDAERTLERRLVRHELSHTDIMALARGLAGFYARAGRIRLAPVQFRARIERELAASEAAFRAAGKPHLLNAIRRSRRCLISFITRRGALLRERVRRGLIVEGHGDLRPEHIYLNGTPRIIDCLEFRADLRIVDPVGEIAYLALECRRLGDNRVATQLLRHYRRRSRDNPPPDLFCFYVALNALIRARIAIQHLSEPGARSPAEWVNRAAAYLKIAMEECRRRGCRQDRSPLSPPPHRRKLAPEPIAKRAHKYVGGKGLFQDMSNPERGGGTID
jgi:aminoglycoside phosphotransferase family enzyme